ncbi:probable serine/threonine-protein kinase At1g09600 [Rhodamnia argentea]|uniref:Probable serine/threonine-protein kinase At1g09600 n=1 Tax=Rhodamnia argentea TaxID=178133 RepID=A0A8B8NKM9_9MYRT|nr:probable serine/threonine-protein kinase At1g09600 [Rhodamnia argentea]
MGCLCSKEAVVDEKIEEDVKAAELSKSSLQLVAPSAKIEDIAIELQGKGRNDGLAHSMSRASSQVHRGSVHGVSSEEAEKKTRIVERPAKGHQRGISMELGPNGSQQGTSRIVSIPHGAEGEQIAAGWPSWLTSVAADAIRGLVPRKAESFKKLNQIGQGTYSTVYKARDLETGKIVAMKKVRFANMDPESVRFMAREIHILRKLDHPNIMKLEGIVTSRISGSLYLVFEYMEHDLAGLIARPGVKLSEPQIKCFMQQLLRGLEHCHKRGVLHRDIKGSNLLISNDGVLKIGDFGLATFFQPDQQQPLTSRVVTLWYRAPELLLGATEYGVAVDLWSTGCILAELFAGEPIMPGRTEVEQLHKIFKLCGSPSEDYWWNTRFPQATSFRTQQHHKRRVAEKFKDFPSSALALIEKLLAMEPKERGSADSALKSEFFMTKPLPCDTSSLPKYPPSKEFDAKLRNLEARRQKAGTVKGRGPESVRRGLRDNKVPTPEFDANGEVCLQGQSNTISISHKFNPQEDSGSGFLIEPPRVNRPNGFSHCSSMIHPSVTESSLTSKGSSRKHPAELKTQKSLMPRATADLSNASLKKDDGAAPKELMQGYVPKKNRIHYSGPLVPPGGNIDDMLKEHERQIQQAVRNARLGRNRTNEYGQPH